jgi:dTDP-4-dehydrorhamnose 3,5-epimerase
MFVVKATEVLGCFEIQPTLFDDERGRFVKVFNVDQFKENKLETNFLEEYYSHSRKGVIRGMHFQTPPADLVKMIYCVHGEVVDAVVDLRRGSPTFGKTVVIALSADRANCVYIPKGLAHGFCSVSDTATLVYKVTSTYNPQHDSGILWSSIGIDWPVSQPIFSERDGKLTPFADFESPFVYQTVKS